MGVHAIRCSNAEELPAKMKEFLEYDGSRPVLMECLVERNEHVFPMVRSPFLFWVVHIDIDLLQQVAAGKALHEQIVHPSLGPATNSKA
jgi:acetolactate synthase-1/2/3 large subunit